MNSGLLTSLRKYYPRDNSDPLENFITEAFAWLLKRHHAFSRFYLQQIASRLKIHPPSSEAVISWSTQANLGGKRPDLLCETGTMAYLFEHKIFSPLHLGQLDNYHDLAAIRYGREGYKLVLVTASEHQHQQNPDAALCWRDVHCCIQAWLKHPEYQADFLFTDFCEMLESEGLGPAAPVSHESILAYLPARGFEANITRLMEQVAKHDWVSLLPQDQGKVEFQYHQWGRVGFYLTGRSEDAWSPGLFAGVLLEPWTDHQLTWMHPAHPDYTIIISFHKDKLGGYEQQPLYLEMVRELQSAISTLDNGFQFYHHLYESTHPAGPNRWHPIHIRIPLLEMLRGTVTSEDQVQRVVQKTAEVIQVISNCQSLWQLRAQLKSRCQPLAASLTAIS